MYASAGYSAGTARNGACSGITGNNLSNPFLWKKSYFAANGHLLNTTSVDFACYLAQLTGSGLMGLFIEEDILELVPPPVASPSYFQGIKERQATDAVITDVDQSMRYFSSACKARNIRSDASHKWGDGVENIVQESRFADLFVFGPETVFNPAYNEVPTPFIKQVLAKVECPAVVAPTLFEDIDTIVFCYDGSRSAMFAIKQFTYLFPQYRDKKVIVLEVEGEAGAVTAKEKIGAWISCYYSQIGFEVPEGTAQEELFKYLLMKERTFVVMGAYGRNVLSSFFHKSTADYLLKRIDLPLFIAHH
ncbi:MAG TPA: universal stress protein [Chitinophagaceae bacterium]|nr:universal stress protein [Chitinophagaceae bacterium]